MKKHRRSVEPHWFDYFSLATMLVSAISMLAMIAGKNICPYTLPVFVIYIAVASCEHERIRCISEKKSQTKDALSEVFGKNCPSVKK